MRAATTELRGLNYKLAEFEIPHIGPDGRDAILKRAIAFPIDLSAHPDDLEFIHNCVRWLPVEWRRHVTRTYSRIFREAGFDRGSANLWLRNVTERARLAPMSLTADEDAVRAKAKGVARQLRQANPKGCRQTLKAYEIAEPTLKGHESLVARCRDELWWRRQLRKALTRATENVARRIGLTHKRAGLYVSDAGLARRRQQVSRNRETLKGLLAVNEDGEEFELEELIDASIANPSNRRAELMVRMHGFERVADSLGHEGDFWTITAPSRFHARNSRSGRPNRRYEDFTVREAHEHLNEVWARIRAAFKRRSIQPYGFRVVEPHHDGTPHWHTLVFLPPEQIDAARAIVRRYALEDSPDEPGAWKHRCKFQRIDKGHGSATGYIAKYVAKNIDGLALRADDTAAPDEAIGKDPTELAERVVTWASIHGIRQFQQIGGPPVGVWREARRLPAEQQGVLEEIRQAADASDWATYVQAMGGPTARRLEQPARVARLEWWMTATGELDTNRYGEPAALKPFGLECGGVTIPTRKLWEILPRDSAASVEQEARQPSGSSTTGESARPWSPVNNCTRTPESYGNSPSDVKTRPISLAFPRPDILRE